jgi:cytochrome c oxidase subunit 2
MTISVTARMWWWEVRYRDPASGREIATANEIRIPAGRTVYLGLNAADVIHSLWVPALAGKRDMIPGRVTGLTLRADKPGIYRGQCAEYCGAQHAHMALQVVALAPAEFDAWLARQASPPSRRRPRCRLRGRAVFLEQRCQSCHTIRGVAERAPGPGPDPRRQPPANRRRPAAQPPRRAGRLDRRSAGPEARRVHARRFRHRRRLAARAGGLPRAPANDARP